MSGRAGVLLGCALAVCLAAAPAMALHPNHPVGRDASRSTAGFAEGIDHVDLFSGSLSLAIPVGPFSLHYGSNVWRYETVVEGGEARIKATPVRQTTAGLGWHLAWGEVYGPQHAANDTGRWLFVDDDGSRHRFYATLHRGEDESATDPDNRVHYTRDNSYLRMRVAANNCAVDIESPDGMTRRFVGTCGPQGTYRLSSTWSPFASAADPDVWVTYNADDTLRTVSDRFGRNHHIHLSDQFSWITRAVTRVDVESVGGQRAYYDFHYVESMVNVSCKDTSDSTPNRIQVPLLVRVDRPDGSSYQMQDADGALYHDLCAGGIDDLPGALQGIDLPTLGKIRWDYTEMSFPPGGTASVFNTAAAVDRRTLLDADGTELGVWRYRRSSQVPAGEDPEIHTDLVYPTGDCRRHFFNARYWVTPSQGRGWEYGLPFVRTEEVAGTFLSSQVWDANDGAGSCAGSKLRSHYLRYRHDLLPGSASAPSEEWYDSHRIAEAERTVFHDDGDRWTASEASEFDGLGHFRRTVTTGNLWSGSTDDERRETFVDFDRSTPVPPSEPWILGVFSATETTEPDAVGSSTRRIEVEIDRQTGFLRCARTLANGTTRSDNDLVTTWEHHPLGWISDVKRFGGDLQPLPTLGSGCGFLPAQPAYWSTFGYVQGVMVNVRQRTPSGGWAPFLDYDVEIDTSTGLVVKRRDPSGFEVTYDYDVAGRPTAVTPSEGAGASFVYVTATPTLTARIRTQIVPLSGPSITRAIDVLDDFGRPVRERRLLPDGSWTSRTWSRNARGWITAVSEWGDLQRKTQYKFYDAFGRPGIVRPPEGPTHDIRYTRSGVRETRTRQQVALPSGDAFVMKTFERDRYGRLRQVREMSGSGGAWTPTSYRYDVGSRLTHIASGVAPQQIRTYTWDNRGLLLAESHPERDQPVVYSQLDAAGLVHRRSDGVSDLGFRYDDYGRLVEVFDRQAADRPVITYELDTALGWGLGKLATATRYQYVDIPWTPAQEDVVRVRQRFRYQGLGGAASWLETTFFLPGSEESFAQSYAYTELGNLADLAYPTCTAGCTGLAAGRSVGYAYDALGWLAAAPGWVDAVTYHPSGAVATLAHANGTVDHRVMQATSTGRLERIFTTGIQPAALDFDTGTIGYDGAGNVKSLHDGATFFEYDKVGRLVTARHRDGLYDRTYQYDSFGNLTAIDREGQASLLAVDATSNRLQAASYDATGNMLGLGPSQYAYDESGRVERAGGMTYLYDASGARALSIADTPGRDVTYHLRDLGGRLLTRFRYRQSAGWTREADYIYAAGRPVARSGEDASSRRHLHLDHLGTPVRVTDAAGALVESHAYTPYGERVGGGTASDPVQFTGHERDAETGTDYMLARQYDPALGRLLSVDPVLGDLAMPQSFAGYSYVLGNPMTLVDPTGLEGETPRNPTDLPACTKQPCDLDKTGDTVFDETTTTAEAPVWGHFLTVEEWLGHSPSLDYFIRDMGIDDPSIFGPPEGFPTDLFYDLDPSEWDQDEDSDDDDTDEPEEEDDFDPGKCPRPTTVADWRRAEAEAAWHDSAHGRLMRDVGPATALVPLGFAGSAKALGMAPGHANTLGISVGVGIYGVGEFQRGSDARGAAAVLARSGPTIGGVDPRCPR